MKLYVAALVLAIAIAVIGIVAKLWILIGLAVVLGFTGFVLFVRNGQGTHPTGSKL